MATLDSDEFLRPTCSHRQTARTFLGGRLALKFCSHTELTWTKDVPLSSQEQQRKHIVKTETG